MKRLMPQFIAVLLLLSFTMMGCGDKTNQNVTQITSGVAGSQGSMMGTVEGLLIDASTNQPIVGAVIDIGVAQATTTANGQFVLRNVPATVAKITTNPSSTLETINTTYASTYNVTINMKGVTSPVTMATTTTSRYSDFEFRTLDVHFETIANMSTKGTGSSGGSIISNIQDVSTVKFTVGKLAASIKGYVAGCYYDDFFANKGAGYTVSIVASSNLPNTGTAQTDNVIATTVTDANGSFTFSNLESNAPFWICAQDANNTMYGCADGDASTLPTAPNFRPGDANMQAVTSPRDGETLILNIQNSNAVHICPKDKHGPVVSSISIENGSDITAGTTDVVFTFSEPIEQTAKTAVDATTIAGVGSTLYDQIEIRFAGVKAGNVDYTLSWNAPTYDQLTVRFTTAVSSKYYVRIPDIDSGLLTDAVGNKAGMGVCADDDNAPAMYGAPVDGVTNDCTVWFTTDGGATAGNPTVVVYNAAILNYNAIAVNTGATSNAPDLDWLPVSGAKGYHVYRRMNEVFSDPTSTSASNTNTHGWQRLTNAAITATAYTDAALPAGDFVENNVTKLTYDYYVTSVNSDGLESTGSNAVTATDVIKPELTAALTFAKATATTSATMDLTFNEPVREGFVENGTYTIMPRSGFTAPTIATNGVRATSPTVAKITFSQLDEAITSISNGLCNYTVQSANDTIYVENGVTAICVAAGPNGVLATVQAGDDVLCPGNLGVCPGPNGLCNTSVAAGSDDVQVIGSGGNGACIAEGGTAGLQTVLTGANDDTLCPGTVLAICPGANGLCDQVAATGDTQVVNVGTALAYKCALPGADNVLNSTTGVNTVVTTAVQAITVSNVVDVSNNLITTSKDNLNVTNATAAGTVN